MPAIVGIGSGGKEFSVTEVVAVAVSPMPPSDKVNVKLVVAGSFAALGVKTIASNALVTSFTEPNSEEVESVPLAGLSSLMKLRQRRSCCHH